MKKYFFATVAALLSLTSTQVGAHAVLMESSPKASERLESSPLELSATFNESVGPIFFRVLDQTGAEVGKPGEIRLDGTKMLMSLGESLPKGTYIFTYRVISADTHPVGATFGFSIGQPLGDTTAALAGSTQTRSAWNTLVGFNRWVLYAALLLAVGSALFVLLLNPPPELAAVSFGLGRRAALFAALAYVLAIVLGGADMVLGGAGALFSQKAWLAGLASTLAPSALLGVPAMLLLYWGMGSIETVRRGKLAFCIALGIASFLVTGHAATAPPAWLMSTVVGVHLLTTAFWMGALVPLYRSVGLLPIAEAGALMVRFSKWAVPAVILVLLSGVGISLKQLGSPLEVFGNDYGSVLLTKLVLVGVILAIAAYNRQKLTPALLAGAVDAPVRIGRTIRFEFLVYILVIAAAMGLTLTTPPRAMTAGATGALVNTLSAADTTLRRTLKADSGHTVEIELSPAKVGENMLMATVKDPSGVVISKLADLEVVVAMESAGINDVRTKAQDVGNGMWHAMIAETLIPGEWTLSIDAFVSDYDKISFRTEVTLR